jgi:hypothetical protein
VHCSLTFFFPFKQVAVLQTLEKQMGPDFFRKVAMCLFLILLFVYLTIPVYINAAVCLTSWFNFWKLLAYFLWCSTCRIHIDIQLITLLLVNATCSNFWFLILSAKEKGMVSCDWTFLFLSTYWLSLGTYRSLDCQLWTRTFRLMCSSFPISDSADDSGFDSCFKNTKYERGISISSTLAVCSLWHFVIIILSLGLLLA